METVIGLGMSVGPAIGGILYSVSALLRSLVKEICYVVCSVNIETDVYKLT